MPNANRILAVATASACFAAAVVAQGTFVNFEQPVSKGLAIASAGGTTHIVAVNPDDNAIVLFNPATGVAQRVAVGMGPASVFVTGSDIYTANFLGDSVSRLEYLPNASPPARLVRTEPIGDEPIDLSVRPGTNELYVLLGSRSEIARLDRLTLAPIGYAGNDNLLPLLDGSGTRVMKYPYRIMHRGDGRAVILNQLAGSNPATGVTTQNVDFDLLDWDHGNGLISLQGTVAPNAPNAGVLGTSNMGMAMTADGRLVVVSNKARNDIVGEPALRILRTGFVESWVHIVPARLTGAIDSRDLNLDAAGAIVAPGSSVSMPTDVVLDEVGQTLQNVFVASFSTDRLIRLGPNGGSVVNWPSTTTALRPRAGYAMAGPRSLWFDPTSRMLYVLCRLDASLRQLLVRSDGSMSPVALIPLQDPAGIATRAGQRFLYDARESGNGKVSCASCHIDGRTDGLAWKLDPPNQSASASVPSELRDGVATAPPSDPLALPGDRGPMVTQTLQGLVSVLGARSDVPSIAGTVLSTDTAVSTQPFYWRGGRATFAAFAGAFQALLGRSAPLTSAEIDAMREHVFTIAYPPNPEQGIERSFDGSLGAPTVPGTATRTVTSGSGTLRGLKLFHNMPLLNSAPFIAPLGVLTAGRSCVECHRLPSGTNGRFTVREADLQPLKTAQMRGLRAREMRFRPYRTFPSAATPYPPSPATLSLLLASDLPIAPHGLLHPGTSTSIDEFEVTGFLPLDPNNPPDVNPLAPAMNDLVRFVRQLDTGIAPIVGVPLSITAANLGQFNPTLLSIVLLAESQVARGNCGLVVHRRVGGVTTDLFFDVTAATPIYADPNGGPTTMPLTGPGGIVPTTMGPNDLIVFQSVPLGSERRVASPAGFATVQVVTTPPLITDVSLVVPDPWQPILQLDQNLPVMPGAIPVPHGSDLPGNFVWQGFDTPPKSLAAMTNFWVALAGQFGVPAARRHEAPRRFRVRGAGIRHGATLTVDFPTAFAGTVPTQFGASLTMSLHPVRLPTETVFETAMPLAPDVVFAMLCGWIAAPGVQSNWERGAPSAALNPVHNQFRITVRNEDPTAPATTTQRALRLE